jgi:hypothetical protein
LGVLAVVPARLGHESAEIVHLLEADRILLVDLRTPPRIPQRGIEVFSIAGQLGDERQVVDASSPPAQLRLGHVEVLGKLLDGVG